MRAAYLFAAWLVLAAVATPGIAASNDAPLADAGLDQHVTRGTTVYLDGGGSRDPDGAIRRYQWTISAESGDATNATSPQCRTCQQTRFRPDATGTYRVTLEVTDDDGATATDTLYVTVKSGDPPTVSLAGPTETTTGEPGRFTADASAGSAPLDRLRWRVDGEPVATERLSGDANTTTRTVRFPTAGTHTVSVTAVDADGQRDTADTFTTVVEATDTTADDVPTERPNDATIVGPQVVTGHGELTAEYELTNGVAGTWHQDGRRVGSGSRTSRTFAAGRHDLYAATPAGVATFSNGSRTVVADPAPELTTVEVEDSSVAPVTVEAVDDYENLYTVSVHVDGDPVETLTTDKLGGRVNGDSLATTTHLESLDPGNHTITVRARDARGQTDVAIRTVEVPGPPEVLSAGFVQDGPLDQYHPRIDESRYTATYRVKVDLNGVDPEYIKPLMRVTGMGRSSDIDKSVTENGILVLEKSSYREKISDIGGFSEIQWIGGEYMNKTSRSISVTPSPPEIRIETIEPQTEYTRLEGIVFDARRSFDPDGTKLEYHWSGTNADTEQSSITLDPTAAVRLQLVDGQDQRTNSSYLLDWFAPELAEATIEEEGPFYPNETVTVSVDSERYYLTKPTYEENLSFRVRSEHGSVVDRMVSEQEPGEVNDSDPLGLGQWHTWTIAVPAKAFYDGAINVSVYPTAHPHMEYNITVPQPRVYESTYSEVTDVSTSVSYLVERPRYTVEQTANEQVRDDLLDAGYEVRGVDDAGHEYQLEKYVKTDPVEYDVDRQRFHERGRRQFFLESNPEWSSNGTTTETRTWTTTETEWRSSRSGAGTFTGNTRRKLVREGEYRTEKQFEYETTETYQTTETYEDTYTTREREIKMQEKCGMFGCRVYQTTVTTTETHTVTRTREVTHTYTVDRTYWSTRPRSHTHEYTGDLRRVTVREPEYEQQYEFEVERQHSERQRVYLAEHRTLLDPASYEWQSWKAVQSKFQAESAARSADVRIAGIEPSKQWTLKKQTGTKTVRKSSRTAGDSVSKTIGQANVTITKYVTREETKQLPEMKSQKSHRIVEHIEDGVVPQKKIKYILKQKLDDKYGE